MTHAQRMNKTYAMQMERRDGKRIGVIVKAPSMHSAEEIAMNEHTDTTVKRVLIR